MSERRVVLTQSTAKRIASATLAYERSIRLPADPGTARAAGAWNPGTYRAIVSSAIAAASGTTPGTGKAKLWRKVDGVMAEAEEIDVTNWFTGSGTIAVGTHIRVSWVEGDWDLGSVDCLE